MGAQWLAGLLVGGMIGFVAASVVLTATVYRRLDKLNDIKEYLRSMGALVEQIRIELSYHVEGHGPSPVHHEVQHNVSESTVREAEQAVDNALDTIERNLSEAFNNVGLTAEWNRTRSRRTNPPGSSWLTTPSWRTTAFTVYRGPATPQATDDDTPKEPEREEVNDNNPRDDIDLEL